MQVDLPAATPALPPLTQNKGGIMRKAELLVAAIAMPVVLGGCVAAAVIPLMAATGAAGYGIFKTVQTSTGGSVEIGIDDTKLTNEQKAQIKNIRSMAVWPDKSGGSVTFAQALSDGGRFKVITPSRVAAALKKLELSDELKLMTTSEAKEAFLKVCQETEADSIVSDRATGGNTNMNMWSFERANITKDFLVTIYEKTANSYIAEIPVSVKVLVGGTAPSSEEISKLANTEVAKRIIALAENPAISQEQIRQPPVQAAEGNSIGSPKEAVSQVPIKVSIAQPLFEPMTTVEIQKRLLKLGYQAGKPDGIMGKRTVDALRKFQKDNSLAITGQADNETTSKLRQK